MGPINVLDMRVTRVWITHVLSQSCLPPWWVARSNLGDLLPLPSTLAAAITAVPVTERR